MDIIKINNKTCNLDGLCAAVCPMMLIDFKAKQYPEPAADIEEWCIKCGQCVAVCPTGSLTHRDIPLEQCPPIQKNLTIRAEQCEQFIRSRRSIRAYKNKPVPDGILVKLIETARYAPTGHNTQSVEWLVVNNKDSIQRILGNTVTWMQTIAKSGSRESTLFKRILKTQESGVNRILRDAPALVIAHTATTNIPINCIIALAYLELTAPSLGLGSCWSGLVFRAFADYPPLSAAVKLPANHRVDGCLIVGYPKYKYQRLVPRKSPVITWL